MLIACLILISCAVTPTNRIWQPWTRIFKVTNPIPLNSKININVEGVTSPLLGEDIFLRQSIKEELTNLLERRGFIIGSDSPQFNLTLRYRTERHDNLYSSSTSYAFNYLGNAMLGYYYNDNSSGLGVSIAQALIALSLSSSTVAQSQTTNVKSYTHTISVEITNNEKKLVWQGESSWDSSNLDLQTDIKTSIQLLICNLPDNNETLPVISLLKSGKELNYFKIMCKDRRFSCPALPYTISFGVLHFSSVLPTEIHNPKALPAYIDLIQTAEYSLPLGSTDYTDPLLNSLWKKVELGGEYRLNNKKSIKILIKLLGKTEGYEVDKCWIATDEEYDTFQNDLEKWRNALIEYYDVYEK